MKKFSLSQQILPRLIRFETRVLSKFTLANFKPIYHTNYKYFSTKMDFRQYYAIQKAKKRANPELDIEDNDSVQDPPVKLFSIQKLLFKNLKFNRPKKSIKDLKITLNKQKSVLMPQTLKNPIRQTQNFRSEMENGTKM